MAKVRKDSARIQKLSFGKRNFYILSIGIVLIFIGFVLMSIGPVDSFWSRTLSPIVLLIAYLGIIPYSIFYRPKQDT